MPRKGRVRWRLAAFADTEGLICYQTYTAAWPRDPLNLQMLAAIINGPVANAFVATREIRSNTIDTIKDIPLPRFDATQRMQVERLIAAYLDALKNADEELFSTHLQREAVLILKAIDAIVLAGYDLPPRAERALLTIVPVLRIRDICRVASSSRRIFQQTSNHFLRFENICRKTLESPRPELFARISSRPRPKCLQP